MIIFLTVISALLTIAVLSLHSSIKHLKFKTDCQQTLIHRIIEVHGPITKPGEVLVVDDEDS